MHRATHSNLPRARAVGLALAGFFFLKGLAWLGLAAVAWLAL